MSNAIAYYKCPFFTDRKSFLTLTRGDKKRLCLALLALLRNKLECLPLENSCRIVIEKQLNLGVNHYIGLNQAGFYQMIFYKAVTNALAYYAFVSFETKRVFFLYFCLLPPFCAMTVYVFNVHYTAKKECHHTEHNGRQHNDSHHNKRCDTAYLTLSIKTVSIATPVIQNRYAQHRIFIAMLSVGILSVVMLSVWTPSTANPITLFCR
jgi:hypothetical protein